MPITAEEVLMFELNVYQSGTNFLRKLNAKLNVQYAVLKVFGSMFRFKVV